ncbi:MAG: hypothetical protein EZS28_008208 [Streblomastix strix]|uniref:Uncharacterized protein n=1 Tax=Streblomastix strix TaxID=222440 RepID=A0A5J4WNW0_9EUKA|nr:MAG: hypothetical protein EZS28_008208 [Streblomastix strix]
MEVSYNVIVVMPLIVVIEEYLVMKMVMKVMLYMEKIGIHSQANQLNESDVYGGVVSVIVGDVCGEINSGENTPYWVDYWTYDYSFAIFCLCSSIYNQRSVFSLFSNEQAEDEDADGKADKGQFDALFY